ncbi:MAG: site-2 protease family protein [Candidatus Pacebacteria bacterium]|nr:site-2 protease family protein [Candidatus Paceibacterota bacterium]
MFIVDLLIFVFILGLVVLVHELGHFLAAKISKVKVEEFGIGFPPKIWRKKIGETEYSIGAIPLGGYNKIYGMDELDEEKDKDPKSYESKGIFAKMFITLGGVITGLLFAVAIFYFLVIGSGFQTSQVLINSNFKFPLGTQENHPFIVGVDSGSPAAAAGIQSKDVILSVNGQNMANADQFIAEVSANVGKDISVSYLDVNVNQVKTADIVPRAPTADAGPLGVSLGDMAFIKYQTITDKILCGFMHTFNFVDYSFVALGDIVVNSIQTKSTEPLASSLTGPVGIFAITKVVTKEGIIPVINFVALLSIALAISNLLPLPALDGAKFIYIILQSINKRVFSKALEMKIEQAGLAFLILLAIAIIFKDFFQFKSIIFGS